MDMMMVTSLVTMTPAGNLKETYRALSMKTTNQSIADDKQSIFK
tara:strand:- start:278 stop:409 length:132 start_codon:yes stop_codon:yes gene_type:complete